MRNTNKTEHNIKESVRKFSDEDVKFLYPRLTQRVGGDLSEALLFIQDRHPEVNKVIMQAGSANAVYDTVDLIDKYIQHEYSKRFMTAKAG